MDKNCQQKFKAAQCNYLLANLASRRTASQTDITFVCGEKELHCHKLILASSSPYFEAMFFSGSFKTTSARKIIFDNKNMDSDTLESVINFIYLTELPQEKDRTEEKMKKLLAASNMMLLENLTVLCLDILANTVCVENCFELWKVATTYQSYALKEAVICFLCNVDHLPVNDQFLSLSFEQLKELVSIFQKKLPNLDELLRRLLVWLMHNTAVRDKLTTDLLDCINTKQLSEVCINNILANEVVMTSSKEIANGMNKLAVGVLKLVPDAGPRNDVKGKVVYLNYTITNFKNLKDCELCSSSCVGGLLWHMEMKLGTEKVKGKKKARRFIGVYIKCSIDNRVGGKDWTSNAKVTVKLSGQKTSVITSQKFKHVFSPHEPRIGWDRFISTKDVLQYVKEEALVLHATIRCKTPE